MMVSQQFVHRRPPDSARVECKNPIAFIESRSDCLLAPAAEIQLPELVETKVDTASLIDVLPQLELLAERQLPRIAIRAKGKIVFVEMADIIAVHAESNCASIKCRPTPYFVRESLCSIAAKLSPYGFIQIRRSVLVNISHVEEIQPLGTSEYRLRVGGGTEYVVTRNYKENLRNVAHLWLGCGYRKPHPR
jgi:DNA-binding LytR/AlgR family response regulator